MDKKDGKTKLIQDFNALGWLQIIFAVIIILVGIFAMESGSSSQLTCVLLAILHFIIALLMFRGKKLAIAGDKKAYSYGIVIGILLILGLDIIDIVLGILVLIDSSNYNKELNNQKNS